MRAHQVPHVSRQDYSLLDISDDGFVRCRRALSRVVLRGRDLPLTLLRLLAIGFAYG
jgi:hypothetical protein